MATNTTTCKPMLASATDDCRPHSRYATAGGPSGDGMQKDGDQRKTIVIRRMSRMFCKGMLAPPLHTSSSKTNNNRRKRAGCGFISAKHLIEFLGDSVANRRVRVSGRSLLAPMIASETDHCRPHSRHATARGPSGEGMQKDGHHRKTIAIRIMSRMCRNGMLAPPAERNAQRCMLGGCG